MNERLAQALAECLEQIEAGAAPSSALAAQPDDLRCELAPLLDAALAVRALPAQPVQPAFRAEVARHLARLESARQPRPARRWRWPIAAADIRRRALATRLAAVAAVIVLVLACAAVASAGSRPGDLLFPVRAGLERLWPGGRLPGPDGSASGPTPGPASVNGEPTLAAAGPIARLTVRLPAVATATRTAFASEPSVQVTASAPPRSQAPPTPMPETPTLAPTPAPAAPSPIAERRERAPTERSEGAARVTPAASPTSTSESGPTPADGTVSLSGSVKQGDQTAHRPLPGATVLLYLSRDIVCDGSGQGPIAGAAYAQATTDADGAFAFRVPPGTYLVAVEGGPECLPRRWHVGVWDPGAADPCAATALALEEDGQAYGLANVLYPDSVGCPTP